MARLNRISIVYLSVLILGLDSGLGAGGALFRLRNLAAPMELSFTWATAFNGNPLNLSGGEIERLRYLPGYLPGVTFRDSWEQQFAVGLTYRLRLWQGHTTRLRLTAVQHYYLQITKRNYHTLSVALDQWFGRKRRIAFRYSQLPSLFIRGYRVELPLWPEDAREDCRYNRETASVALSLPGPGPAQYRFGLEGGRELYNAPFSRFNVDALGVMGGLSGRIGSFHWNILTHWGHAWNANHLDAMDRSYLYLKNGFSLARRIPFGGGRVTLTGYWQEKRYRSDNAVDPIHAGRYQQEWRLELGASQKVGRRLEVELVGGKRRRKVFSAYPLAEQLKSFSRWWGAIRVKYNLVWDMYL